MHQHKHDARVSTQYRLGRAIELTTLAERCRSEGRHKDAARFVAEAMRELHPAHKILSTIGQGEL
jgi:hypothetical protein